MFKTQSYDVAVIGGGMVGLATACGLAKSGLQVVVIDSREATPATGEPRLRVSAINKASQALLENLGAWQNLPQNRLAPYSKMDVWEKDGMGAIQFDAANICEHSLGTIVENDAIQYALAQVASDDDNITLLENERIRTLAFGEREAWITLERGDSLSAALVVAADGANSWVRKQCQIPLTFWDYDHQAIVATIKTQLPHNGCARQAFSADGPLAFLPLYEADLCSIVWSLPPERAEELLAMDADSFNKALTAAFDGKLGLCELQSERQSFPLRMRFARHFAQHRLVLAGDAAHTIHPLAGQGVNLGYRDVDALLDVLGNARAHAEAWASHEVLKRYQTRRMADNFIMQSGMDLFYAGFSNDVGPVRILRNIGLMAAERAGGLKRQALKYALGL